MFPTRRRSNSDEALAPSKIASVQTPVSVWSIILAAKIALPSTNVVASTEAISELHRLFIPAMFAWAPEV
jgi:hypothetical protein